MKAKLHVGTYARNGGAGLHPLCRSAAGWTLGEACSHAQNASFGTYSARHDLYYFVDEQEAGAVTVLRDSGRGWERLACVATRGADPCYIALSGDETLLAVANYASGSIAMFRLDERTGLPLDRPIVRQNTGCGPVEERQHGPHAHCVCFCHELRWVYHIDLGTDEIIAYPLDPATGSLGARTVAYRAPDGSGPRHLVLHPTLPLALLLSELANTLTVLEADRGKWIARQVISTLPPAITGHSLGGHLSLNAASDRAYVSNRGHDSVAVFAWDTFGRLELLQHVASGGASPRSFVVLEAERQVVLANEKGGSITAFDLHEDGTLSPTDMNLRVAGAAFLLVAA